MTGENQYMANIEHTLRLKLQNILTGRDKEIEAIKMQFDTVLEGHPARTVITGDIGIGKTALVKTALADLSKLNAVCVYGKFEQYKDEEPYIAIIQIIENITNHILTLSPEKLDSISKELKSKLGTGAALLTEIVPQIEKIIGRNSKPKVNDYKKLRIRLEGAFQEFISVAAQELYPLIIAVDDLQWADKSSWDIIRSINNSISEYDLYIILACRNNVEEYITRLKSMLDVFAGKENLLEINLENISCESVKAILTDVFGGNIENINKIARLIHRKTLGNPLYIKQMVNLLMDSKETFDAFAPDSLLPSDIEDMIKRKIDGLSPQIINILEIAACIGSRFSLELLKKITNNKDNMLKEKLKSLCCTGLIVENFIQSGADCTSEFEFFHDRIHQNVYEQIDPDRREQLHFDIAMYLLNHSDKIYVEENLLSITSHLLNCKYVIKREGARERLTVDLYFAGIKAKQSAAVEHALKLLSLCEELLGDTCWQQDYGNTLKIKLELAQCEYICGRYDASKAHFEELLTHAASKEDLAEIKKLYMILSSYTGDYARVIDLGIQALQHLGFNINKQRIQVQIAKEMLYGQVLFRDSRLEAIKNAPIINDKRIIEALEILTVITPSANLTDENLFALIVLRISNLSAKYGNSLYSPLGYAAYSLIQGSVLGDFKKAKKVKEIAIGLVELIDDNSIKCIVYFVVGTFLDHWTSSVGHSYHYLQRSFDCGIKSGEFLYSGFTITSMIEMKYSMGEPLKEVKKILNLHKKHEKKMNHDILLRLINIFADHINALESPGCSLKNRLISDEEISRLDTSEGMTYYLLKLQRLYLDGKIEEAYEVSQKTIKQLDSIRGYFLQVDFVFYFLLLSLERKKNKKDSPHVQDEKAFRKYRKKLKAWAELSPDNHWGKHLLIEALFRSVTNRKQDAAGLYDEAIEHAKENNNLQLEALGNYLAADFFRRNRRIAQVYARDACRLYNEWGAGKIANQIGMLFEINADFTTSETNVAGVTDERLKPARDEMKIFVEERLREHGKELEMLEPDEANKYFLNTVCREAKADFGAILLENKDRISLEYIWQDDSEAVTFLLGIDMEQVDRLPKKVLRYVGRTYEEVIIDVKPAEGPFASDDHIRSRAGISIICLPLKYHDIFAGFIYLEGQSDYRFNSMIVEYVKRLSFYLVAKQALEKESGSGGKIFINDEVKDQLTERETEVLFYMAEGMSNKGIGEKLYISSSTVKTHTKSIYGKLEVSSRVQAVVKAKALRLI